jgi:outer membrane protein OmpA-like peptidoglycan-associated protein
MDMNIPLTIVKGTILAGTPAKPVSAKIRVLDLKTGAKLKYVYNPNPKTGRYLLILPPNNDYTMIIESEDFLPQRIILQIPEQKKFFELFQSIRLMPVMSLGQRIGEQVEINNSFMEAAMQAEAAGEVGEAGETDDDDTDYAALFNLMDKIITTTDTIQNDIIEYRGLDDEQNSANDAAVIEELFTLVDEAFEHGDTETLDKIQENTIIPDKFEQVFLYSEDMESTQLKKVIIGSDTIFTSPEMVAFDENLVEKTKQNDLIGIKEEAAIDSSALIVPKKRQFTAAELRRSKEEDRRTIITHTIYFDVNSYECDAKSKTDLKEIAELIINNNNLGFSVLGYADMTGDADYNKELSQKRSFNIVENLEDYGVNTSRAIIRGIGEVQSSNKVYKNDRRVDVTIFELIIE